MSRYMARARLKVIDGAEAHAATVGMKTWIKSDRETGVQTLLKMKAGDERWSARAAAACAVAVMWPEPHEKIAWDFRCAEAVTYACTALLENGEKDLKQLSIHYTSHLANLLVARRERLPTVVCDRFVRAAVRKGSEEAEVDGPSLGRLLTAASETGRTAEEREVQKLMQVFWRTRVETHAKAHFLKCMKRLGVAPETRMDVIAKIDDIDIDIQTMIKACECIYEAPKSAKAKELFKRVIRILRMALALDGDPSVSREGAKELLACYDNDFIVVLVHQLSEAALGMAGGASSNLTERKFAFAVATPVISVLLLHASAHPAETVLTTQRIVHMMLVFSRHYHPALHLPLVSLVRRRPGDRPVHQIALVVHLSKVMKEARAVQAHQSRVSEEVLKHTETTIRGILSGLHPSSMRQTKRALTVHTFLRALCDLPEGLEQYEGLAASALEVLSLDSQYPEAWRKTFTDLAAVGWKGSDVLPDIVACIIKGHDRVHPHDRAPLFRLLLEYPQVEPDAFSFFASQLVRQRKESGLTIPVALGIRKAMAERSFVHAPLSTLLRALFFNHEKSSAA